MTDLLLPVVLGLAAVAGALVVGVSLAALRRRRSVPYLLVTLALATLLGRTVVGVGLMVGGLDDATHHALEHGLDAVMAGLVIAAAYTARRARGVTDDHA